MGGFFRQYPIYYVVADERDVIGVRTNFRGENVWLYRLRAPPQNARALLLDYVKSMNALARAARVLQRAGRQLHDQHPRHVQHLEPGQLSARTGACS